MKRDKGQSFSDEILMKREKRTPGRSTCNTKTSPEDSQHQATVVAENVRSKSL